MLASRVSILLNANALATQAFTPILRQSVVTPLTFIRLAHTDRKGSKPAPKKIAAAATKSKAPAKAVHPVQKAPVAKPKKTATTDKSKAQKEKEKERAQKEKEKERAQKEKEKERAQKEKEKERAQKEKEKEKAQKEKEKEKAQKEKEKEKERVQKEKERAEREKAKEEKEKKPKRPASPYLLFASEQFPSFKQRKPDAKVSEITKLIAEKWKGLGDAEKQKYVNAAQGGLEKYRVARAEYDRERQANKKPATGYALYVKQNLQSVRSANPSLSVTQAMVELGKRWKSLSESQKKAYLKK
eukprot:TRINITY_DN4_c0_g2_i1.p1 TRINITY_DN4_c0_g2~~TRINITY_DN4_c0_g2_i1.p1  ORF type:complete len:317 (-),score=134.52 TRINITY_DN4_c0_g2_i1:353-1252(-)